MVRQTNCYHVFLNGAWQKFKTFEEAEKAEAEANAARINAARQKGLRVIMLATPAPREPRRDREIVVCTEED